MADHRPDDHGVADAALPDDVPAGPKRAAAEDPVGERALQDAAAEPNAGIGPDGPTPAGAPEIGESTGEVVELPATEASAEGEREWWDDPAMPWRRKPTRADIACMAWLGFLGVFSMAMLPLRAWLLGAPERLPWLVGLMGSRSGTAALGSVVRVGVDVPFIWPILLGTLSSIKLDWTYWWAGRLWGRGMIDVWAGQSPRSMRTYARVERWANKMGWLGIFVAYVPIPLPLMGVIFVLTGAHGMGLKKFMVLDFIAALSWLVGFFVFGYLIGEPAVALLDFYAKVANYVAIALVVVVVVMSAMRSSGKLRQA